MTIPHRRAQTARSSERRRREVRTRCRMPRPRCSDGSVIPEPASGLRRPRWASRSRRLLIAGTGRRVGGDPGRRRRHQRVLDRPHRCASSDRHCRGGLGMHIEGDADQLESARASRRPGTERRPGTRAASAGADGADVRGRRGRRGRRSGADWRTGRDGDTGDLLPQGLSARRRQHGVTVTCDPGDVLTGGGANTDGTVVDSFPFAYVAPGEFHPAEPRSAVRLVGDKVRRDPGGRLRDLQWTSRPDRSTRSLRARGAAMAGSG